MKTYKTSAEERARARARYAANREKSCNAAKAWYARNRERAIAAAKARRQRNPEKIRAAKKLYAAANKEKLRASYARWSETNRLKLRIRNWLRQGIDVESATIALLSHNGRCTLCDAPQPGGGRNSWNVDHDHQTGRVRGVLCHKCNVGLGLIVDRVGLTRISAYLTNGVK